MIPQPIAARLKNGESPISTWQVSLVYMNDVTVDCHRCRPIIVFIEMDKLLDAISLDAKECDF